MAKSTEAASVEAAPAPAAKFTKGQLLGARRYQARRDILAAILNDKTAYSHAEVGKLVDEFLKGKVK